MIGKQSLLLITAILGLFCTNWVSARAAQDIGYNVTSELWAKAVLEPATGPVTLVWKQVGADITPSGDTVIGGYFYADPADFAYGSQYNPEVFVKIYIAANGWCNMAFNHVTVDNVTVYSAHNYTGSANQAGTLTLANRLAEHEYTGVGTLTGTEYDGTWKGGAVPTTLLNDEDELCGAATLSLTILNSVITGTARSTSGDSYDITGDVDASGDISAGFAASEGVTATITGDIDGHIASGSWSESLGCKGTWSVVKE
jgi:hypothetical protein